MPVPDGRLPAPKGDRRRACQRTGAAAKVWCCCLRADVSGSRSRAVSPVQLSSRRGGDEVEAALPAVGR